MLFLDIKNILISVKRYEKGGEYVLNYANLNDVEFEYLCKDVMSNLLNIELHRYATGKDGGIDLTNSIATKDVIIQVKHYTKTSASGLITSLKKEVEKVNTLKPKQYYVCCSKELSPDNVLQIYNLFSDYMDSDNNIITLSEIDEFLINPLNIEILRKHYKLWIASTGILQDIFTNDIFIDSEMLLSDIEKQVKFFVQTQVYDAALKCLEKNHALFLTGDPGVGKTITSKMLVLYFSTQEYSVRYTTNGTDLSQLKRSLSQNREKKEVILLDDCFGQAYFNMKETQSSELLSLIKYIHLSANKLLILNSRVTIFREAKVRNPELVSSFENKEYKVNVIDINQMSNVEKAKIFYNHLYFNQVDELFWNSIRNGKRYRDVITHRNYNPRIIEFVSNPHRFAESQFKTYIDFVMGSLNNPRNIWHDEYERKLNQVDRIFLSSLYSLTETSEKYDYVKSIFEHRISCLPDIDLTINHFESSLLRLQESFIKIVGIGLNRMLSMINPSINDYLSVKIARGTPEHKNILNNSVSVKQLKRLLNKEEFEAIIKAKMDDTSILSCVFETESNKNSYVAYQVFTRAIYNTAYKKNIHSYLDEFNYIETYEKVSISKSGLLKLIFNTDMYNYYLSDYFVEWEALEKILYKLEFLELIETISCCHNFFSEWHDEFMEKILEELDEYCSVEASDFDYDLSDFLEHNTHYGEYGCEIDTDQAAYEFENSIKDSVADEIKKVIDTLPMAFNKDIIMKRIDVDVNGAEEVIESYVQSMYQDDDDDSYHLPNDNGDYLEMDYIFDRK